MSLKSKDELLSEWVSQWQGHLLSCPGQLKIQILKSRSRKYNSFLLLALGQIIFSICISVCLEHQISNPMDHFTDLTIWTTSSSWRTWSLPTRIGWCLALVPQTRAYLRVKFRQENLKQFFTWARWWWFGGSYCRSPPQCTWQRITWAQLRNDVTQI